MTTVMVSGYFDGMHSGHIRFLEEASQYGRVIVAIGCDARLLAVKGQQPLYPELERLYMVQACKYVNHAFVMPEVSAEGGVVWESYLERLKPAYFLANDDMPPEWSELQRKCCERHGVGYRVLKRSPPPGFEARSSTGLRKLADLPYRVVLSTWMDQMQLSRLAPGPCVGFSIEPTVPFAERCGMGTSSRNTIRRIWGDRLPRHFDPIEMARIAFAAENGPEFPVDPSPNFPWGTFAPRWITGSIDPITLLVPGVSLCSYSGAPWPASLDICQDEEVLAWLERVVTLVPTKPRPAGDAFDLTPTKAGAELLGEASRGVWSAIQQQSVTALAEAVNSCRETIDALSRSYLGNGVREVVAALLAGGVRAAFPQGAGCGGYIACIDDNPGDRIQVRIRRPVS